MGINLTLRRSQSQSHLCHTIRRLVVPVFMVLNPGFSSVRILYPDHGVLAPKLCELVVQVFDHEWTDIFRYLRRNETDAELA